MIGSPSYQFYCLSHKNDERKNNMKRRFNTLNINCVFNEGVSYEDHRIKKHGSEFNDKKAFSCCYGHLDMISHFYHRTNKDFGIFCEDDIFIHKDLAVNIDKIISDAIHLKLDVLLLGYLLRIQLDKHNTNSDFPFKCGINEIQEKPFYYFDFHDTTWGTQMYMISRSHAKYLLNKYNQQYADETLTNKDLIPFIADFIFTKEGNRALISPILAVEDNINFYEKDSIQYVFHNECFQLHYNKELFIV
jgi:GR25 family glycosyltransferase involved in LPS biosynthesis